MISPGQLRDRVIVPTLLLLGLSSAQQFVDLLLGTAAQESGCGEFLHQKGGPALGIWQMEPATEQDIWTNYLSFRPTLSSSVTKLLASGIDRTAQLEGNLYYAAGMARIRFLRSPEMVPVPPPAGVPQDAYVRSLAGIYLRAYNAGGKATEEEFVANWQRLQARLSKED